MHKVKTKPIFSVFLLAVLIGCHSSDDDVLLKIERQKVKIDAIHKYITRRDLPLCTKTKLNSLIQELTADQLMLYDAYKQKYHHRDEVKAAVAAFQYNTCIEFFFKRHLVDSLITEKVLIDRYRALSLEYRAYHPFKKVRDDLYEDELARRRLMIEETVANYYQHLKVASMLRLLQPAFNRFLAHYNELYRNQTEKDSLAVNPAFVLESMLFDSALAQIKNRQYTRAWLIKTIKERQINVPTGVLSPTMFSNIIENLILEELIYNQAKSEKIDQEPAFRQAVQRYRDDIVLHLYQVENISNRIIAGEDSLRAFYKRNKEIRYLSPAAVEVWTIFIQDSLKASSILNKALRGEDFTKLFRRYNSRPVKNQGYLGYITSVDYGTIGKIAVAAGANRIVPELVPVGKFFVVIKTGRFIPATPLDYNKIRQQVSIDYAKERYESLRQQLALDLQKKYQTCIYYDKFYKYVEKIGAEN